MFRNYQEIFSLPGALKFSLAGLIARFPIAILGLGVVLFIQGVLGTYALAGLVAAVFMLVQAVSNPIIARLVDIYGQARVMLPIVGIHIIGLIGLLLAVFQGWWIGFVFIFAGISGATVGSLGSLVRARWNAIITSRKQLDTAFSWESVADEMLFVTGPMIVTFLATVIYPAAGIIASMVTTVVGSALFYSQKSTEPIPQPHQRGAARGKVLSNFGIFVVVIAHAVLGVKFGALDIIAVAFAEEAGHKPMAGVLVSAMALGSLLAGIFYGVRTWKAPVQRRLAIALSCLAALTWPMLLASSMLAFGVTIFTVGLALAPSLIAAASVIQELAPPHRLTEALAWIGTSLGLGVAIGSAISGVVIDTLGAREALILPAVCATLAALLAIAFNRQMDPATRSHAARQNRTVINTITDADSENGDGGHADGSEAAGDDDAASAQS
ncbi:MFS transporter [Brevibacterium otitidis]|uniref:MFS transporter n=1 Tax=Brevibacterium otitidis TaxID=53364 RepID=A0ABV5X001_9MICO|nr:MFS transporter [Brevibacterium otitidis]BFF08656.1 MFS transporter [Brevibacterium otitidis]